ncbi:phage tail sheath family protein [Paraflavitalea pollutisoli]|uniref:phage tail sheath family protein n=1 Tax=Paraflavitalea pollutisoli TaxID=3034143 RepID=UPI0023EB9E43|nr:phage tail sheath C-terminal domain-containing protein [Paraflavitalea sp. H1-2-19X]
MADYTTPGVYIEEVPQLPPSITAVDTAIPAFIGYTERARDQADDDLLLTPRRISSWYEYEHYFGRADAEQSLVVSFGRSTGTSVEMNPRSEEATRSKFVLYYSLQLYFANGGGPCYIVSVGNYATSGRQVYVELLLAGLEAAGQVEEVTLLCFPDALGLPDAPTYYLLMGEAINQAEALNNRFVLMDLYAPRDDWRADRQMLRDHLPGTVDGLRNAAVYWPVLVTRVNFEYKLPGTDDDDDALVKIEGNKHGHTLAELKENSNTDYLRAKDAVRSLAMNLPAAPAMAGIYTQIDSTRGVWKAPANVGLELVVGPYWGINDANQGDMNVDVETGRSINAIRFFKGKGTVVWGARTLAGNDNDWRYIPVRRFYMMVEESVKKGTEQFVFEPNDRNTWVRVKSMIDLFLTQQWKAGALQGSTAHDAFFVKVGLGETMTELDIQEGRMIIEIGMAVTSPAEFMILRIMHKMLAES